MIFQAENMTGQGPMRKNRVWIMLTFPLGLDWEEIGDKKGANIYKTLVVPGTK